MIGLCGLLAVGLPSCGDASQDAIKEAEKRGAEYKAEKEKERKLEREIEKLSKERQEEKKRRRHHKKVAAEGSSTTASPAPAPAAEHSSCGGGLEVGPDTTCEFAQNVRAEYELEIGAGSGTVYAYSPALEEWFEMFCTASPHECSGAISAKVYFP